MPALTLNLTITSTWSLSEGAESALANFDSTQVLQDAETRAAEAVSEASTAKSAAGEATAEAAAAEQRAVTLRSNLESIQESHRKARCGAHPTGAFSTQAGGSKADAQTAAVHDESQLDR